jgi:hypothetical protein
VKITTTSETTFGGAIQCTAQIELVSTYGVSGMGKGSTIGEACRDAIDSLARELKTARKEHDEKPAAMAKREAIAALVAATRALAACDVQVSVTMHGNDAVEVLLDDGAKLTTRTIGNHSEYDDASLEFDAYGSQRISALGDTREIATVAAEPEPAEPEPVVHVDPAPAF